MSHTQPPLLAEGQERVKLILLVEDDATIAAFLQQMIVQETVYHSQHVTNGFRALQAIERITPNLFLLDYQLPGMNGIELYDRLHAMKGLRDVPAIMISARLPQQELAHRYIVGIRKPFDLDELLSTINRLLA